MLGGHMPKMTTKKDGFLDHHQHTLLSRKKGNIRSCRKCGNRDGHENIYGYTGSINNERTFKRGPWTSEEDALLIEYVKKHGERHWNCVQNTGLIRCGKSCRLRWTNHLRPDLKKGAFSPEEERIVLELHAKLGNKWSKIAAELPGRTDNEVKNFWNTKIKRRMKIEASILNSDGHNQKLFGNFDHHVQHRNNPHAHIHPDLSISIPNTSHSSFSPLSTPISISMPYSLSKPNSLSNQDLNLINSTNICDPISSFLNNPTYKFKLLLEDESTWCDANNFDINFPLIPKIPVPTNPNITVISSHTHPNNTLNSSNNVLVENLGDNVMLTSNKIRLPLHQMIHEEHSFATPPSSVITSTNNRFNNMYNSWSIGNNSEEDKSSIIDEGKSSIGKDLNGVDKEMIMKVNSRLFEEHSPKLLSIGMKKSKIKPCEEAMSMDDDLSSLLYDFSVPNSPLL